MKKFTLLLALPFLASCATVFSPAKEKVTINSDQPKATVYLNGVQNDLGEQKLVRGTNYQVVVKSPGYADNYSVIVQKRHSHFYPIAIVLDVASIAGWVYIGVDAACPKSHAFDRVINLPLSTKLENRKDGEKYIDLSSIDIDMKDKSKDIEVLTVPLHQSSSVDDAITEAEDKRSEQDEKAEAKLERKGKSDKKLLLDDDDKTSYVDTKFTDQIFATLKTTGYIDTVNRVFADNNNTLVLEGAIKKIYSYVAYYMSSYVGSNYCKSKIVMRWYIKNPYEEILDSLDETSMSGDFTGANASDFYGKMIGDAVQASYLKLHTDPRFLKYTKVETNFASSDAELMIPAPTSVVAKKTDASGACVIVKTKDGHGSGFAISNDGYILTNYHVIAGRLTGKPNDVTIITSENESIPGTIVRYNKFRDIALIKVDKKFDMAFNLSNKKSFQKLDDVFTVGAPTSLELGESISAGIISNERNSNNNVLLQLGMSVSPGNSGGPLFNSNGVLDGVVCSKLVGENVEGVAFAVPSYLIQDYLNIKYK